jgi:hypothetical protein
MTYVLKSREIGKWRSYAGSVCWVKKIYFEFYRDSSLCKRNKVRMIEMEDQVPVIIWIISDKIGTRSGEYCN